MAGPPSALAVCEMAAPAWVFGAAIVRAVVLYEAGLNVRVRRDEREERCCWRKRDEDLMGENMMKSRAYGGGREGNREIDGCPCSALDLYLM